MAQPILGSRKIAPGGYAPVSPGNQSLYRQPDALHASGGGWTFVDKLSGTSIHRTGGGGGLGDRCMSRCLFNPRAILAALATRETGLGSLEDHIAHHLGGKVFFGLIGVMAQMGIGLRKERAVAEPQSARTRGRTGGRARFEDGKLDEVRNLKGNSTMSAVCICKSPGIIRHCFFILYRQKEKKRI